MSGVPLTTRESKILLQLSEHFDNAEEEDVTEEELDAIEAKLRVGSTNEFEARLIEAATVCSHIGSDYLTRLEIVDLGVRVTVLYTGHPHRECALICPWTDLAMCHINPLLSTINRAIRELAS